MQISQPIPKLLYVYVTSYKLHIAAILASIQTVVCEAETRRTLLVSMRCAGSQSKFLGTNYTLRAGPTFSSKEPYCKTEPEHVRCHSRLFQTIQRLEPHALFKAT